MPIVLATHNPHKLAEIRALLAHLPLQLVGLSDLGIAEDPLEPRGANGFGYDPLFLPDETPGRTMAELTPEEKNAISHRGRALRRIAHVLETIRAV